MTTPEKGWSLFLGSLSNSVDLENKEEAMLY